VQDVAEADAVAVDVAEAGVVDEAVAEVGTFLFIFSQKIFSFRSFHL
jgi:hypothetical protein